MRNHVRFTGLKRTRLSGGRWHPIGVFQQNLIVCLLMTGWSSWFAVNVSADPATLDPPSPPPLSPKDTRGDTHRHAIEVILESARSADPFTRANSIEAMQPYPKRLIPMIQLALEDDHPAVRFTGLATMGKLKLTELIPAAKRCLDDESVSVNAAAIFALSRCGESVDITPLSKMMASQDPSLRANAALLLGLTGDPSAIPMLKDLAKAPMPRAGAAQAAIVRIQVAEALVRLGDDTALSALRAGGYSQFDEVRVLAVSMMGELGDRRMERAFAQMMRDPPIELQIAAAGTLAQLGRFEGIELLLKTSQIQIPTVRAQSALTLQYFSDTRAQTTLETLLNDPVEQVRLSAAAAVLKRRQELAHSPPDDND